MDWLILSLITALLWGIGQIVIKKGFDHMTPLTTNLISILAVFLFWMPFSLYKGVTLTYIPQIFELTLLIAASYFIFYYALEKGEVVFTGTILATYPLVTVLLSRLLLGEQITPLQTFAIFIIILGAVLLTLPTSIALKALTGTNWLIWAVAGALIIGTADVMAKIAITATDVYTYLFTLALSYLPVAGIFWFLDRKGRVWPRFSRAKFLPTLVGVSMMEIGMISFTLALESGLASLVVPLSSIYAAITAVLGVTLLKEKLAPIHAMGIMITVMGIVLMGLGL